ncbi:MAG: hypothetical protein JW795_06265, partial [Chitinivibrionales bacterium]|nr:hypothetical protein [Chitinivibrionales bacterium]
DGELGFCSDAITVNPAQVSDVIGHLVFKRDFEYDEYRRNVLLTEQGIERIEASFACGNIYAPENGHLLMAVHYGLHAHFLLHRNIDYIVRRDAIELVDEFTGRVADKRRWPDGLHEAIEAKEGITIKTRGTVLNSIPLQHFIRLYPNIRGMTATAQPAYEELKAFYNLDIVVVGSHRPCIRNDLPDLLFPTLTAKFEALYSRIAQVHATRQPVLVGTRSVKESVRLSEMLIEKGIACTVLNATNDAAEAHIISQAGMPGAVTISTNMAGRGTDIRLGGADQKYYEQVVASGGLCVLGTNRHESVRIDNQLRGRAGRQGDPGASQFFISLEDDLCCKYNLTDLFPKQIKTQSKGLISDPVIGSEIGRMQRIIEGQNLEIKITLFKYSLLIEQQRSIITQQRSAILDQDAGSRFFASRASSRYEQLDSEVGSRELTTFCRELALLHHDRAWSLYCAEIAAIRESIHLRRIGGQDPFFEFNRVAITLFDHLEEKRDLAMIESFNAAIVCDGKLRREESDLRIPSSTWTYLISDNPFETMLGMRIIGDIGLSIAAGIWWPLLALVQLFKKKVRT